MVRKTIALRTLVSTVMHKNVECSALCYRFSLHVWIDEDDSI